MNGEEMTAHGAAAVRQMPEYRRICRHGRLGLSARAASHAIYLGETSARSCTCSTPSTSSQRSTPASTSGQAVGELGSRQNAVGAVMAEAAERSRVRGDAAQRASYRAISKYRTRSEPRDRGLDGHDRAGGTLLGSESERSSATANAWSSSSTSVT